MADMFDAETEAAYDLLVALRTDDRDRWVASLLAGGASALDALQRLTAVAVQVLSSIQRQPSNVVPLTFWVGGRPVDPDVVEPRTRILGRWIAACAAGDLPAAAALIAAATGELTVDDLATFAGEALATLHDFCAIPAAHGQTDG